MDYWNKVLRGAWDKTRHPLGWDRKKFAVALLAIGALIASGLHFGWLAMFESAASIFWAAFPPAFAAAVLFIWGIIETQASMYRELAIDFDGLNAALKKGQASSVNYEAWKHVPEMSLKDASFLWCNKVPAISMPSDVTQWYNALSGAIKTGALKFVADYGGTSPNPSLRQAQYHYQKQNPNLNTTVSRQALKDFAAANDHDPIFLRDL